MLGGFFIISSFGVQRSGGGGAYYSISMLLTVVRRTLSGTGFAVSGLSRVCGVLSSVGPAAAGFGR